MRLNANRVSRDGGDALPLAVDPTPRPPAPHLDPPAAPPAPRVPAPGALRMLLSLPGTLALYFLRWGILVRVGGLDGDLAARARRWARWERRYRPAPEGEAMARVDYWTYAVMRQRWPARTALSVLTLPFRAGAAAYRLAAEMRNADGVKPSGSILAQALEIWLLALRYPLTYGSDPGLYYLNRIHEPDRRGDAPFVFATLQQGVLTGLVNGTASGSTDKGDFEANCAEAGLPHIPVVARVDADGRIGWPDGATALPAEDLFSKPIKGSGGTGAARWLWEPEGRYCSETGALFDAAALLRELRAAAQQSALVVQRRVRNHPEVEALVGPTLATIRLVSVLMPDGAFEPVLAIHRSAPRDAAVDNSSQGGVAAPIDLRTGELGEAAIMNGHAIEFSRTHPRTGTVMVGARLPCWTETLALVERAHRVFTQHPVVGWDVALTDTGPVLVEANTLCVVKSLQAVHGRALGRMRYAALLLELIEGLDARGRRRRA